MLKFQLNFNNINPIKYYLIVMKNDHSREKQKKIQGKIILKPVKDLSETTSKIQEESIKLQDILLKTTTIIKKYPSIETYYDKTIVLYAEDYKKEIEDNNVTSWDYFKYLYQNRYFSFDDSLKKDILKILVLAIQENAYLFMKVFPNSKDLKD